MVGNKQDSHEKEEPLFADMTPTQKNRYRTYLADPQTGASCEMQSAREAIENYWNLEGGRTNEDRDELMSELDCIDDSLEELRDDYGWDGYDDAITALITRPDGPGRKSRNCWVSERVLKVENVGVLKRAT